ncbi:MAG: ABC transporter ATP-binding protein [Candidatus Dojkabacteria bacterium]
MRQLLRLFYQFNLRYKKAFISGLSLTVLGAIASNFSNFFYKFFVDSLQGFKLEDTLIILGGLVLVRIVVLILQNTADIVSDIFIIRAARDVRLKVFSHLHKLDFSFHANKHSGSLISAMKRGDGAFFSFNMQINRNLLRVIIDFGFIVITFSLIDVRFMFVVLAIVAVNLIIARFLVRLNIVKRKLLNKEEDDITAIIVDNMINYETVKYFAKEGFEEKRMEDQYSRWYTVIWEYANTFRLINVSTGFLSIVGSAIVILLALFKTTAGNMSLGEFILVVTFLATFFPRLTEMIYQFREIAKHYTDLEKYIGLLNEPVTVVEANNALTLKTIKGKIQFKDVHFKYHKRENILNNFNLVIKPGESVAFVGASGAGKTTLVKLILRFYDIDKGTILIDGKDISKATKQSLRNSIGIVPQEPVLFNNTIAYNISYATTKANKSGIVNAAKLANLHDFIDSLPEKYDTFVGERGIKLSGGQKQRLAIARMFIEDPPIIVFDEATSQLDSESEKLIQDAFWRVAKDKTTIIIAHRLSTIMKVDRIIVLKDGKIVEQGKHEELIKKKVGVYKGLWELQRGGMI